MLRVQRTLYVKLLEIQTTIHAREPGLYNTQITHLPAYLVSWYNGKEHERRGEGGVAVRGLQVHANPALFDEIGDWLEGFMGSRHSVLVLACTLRDFLRTGRPIHL